MTTIFKVHEGEILYTHQFHVNFNKWLITNCALRCGNWYYKTEPKTIEELLTIYKKKDMKIIVQGKEIETKEITQITEAPKRCHGFTINLVGEKSVFIGEGEEYNMYNSEKANINDRYRNLRKRVEEKWNEDKTEFVILNL